MSRCTYQPEQLRCVREEHPDDPTAHVRVADSWHVGDDEAEGGDQ